MRLFYLVLTIILSTLVSQSQIRAAEPQLACSASPMELDCDCVESLFNETTKGFTAAQRKGTINLVNSAMMVQGATHDEQSFQAMVEVMDKVQPLMFVSENCKKTAISDNRVTMTDMNDVLKICESSPLLMDCGCVTFEYGKATNDIPEEAKDYLKGQVAEHLRVKTNNANRDLPPAVVYQYMDKTGELGMIRETCSIASESGLSAARQAPKNEDLSLEARAKASPRDTMRLWCQAESKESPAFCACQVQMYSELIEPNVFRFQGESLRALASARLGQFAEKERYTKAAEAMGFANYRDLKKQSDKAFKDNFEKVFLACHTAERQTQSD